jgi:rSAM/selenodomain-associated transferase 2
MQLAIVVPVLNEAANLPALLLNLSQVSALQGTPPELVLVDGGSSDSTVALARAAGVKVIDAPRCRAQQMNAGAQATQAPNLLFLHADTRLPPQACALVQDALQQHAWGRFDVYIEGRLPMLRLVAGLMNWRSRLSGIATGDQAMFMTRQAFELAGGFADQPLMEDIAMSTTLKTMGPPACLRQKVTTSGRRWEQRGLWATIFLMWRLRLAYWLGAAPAALARAYR